MKNQAQLGEGRIASAGCNDVDLLSRTGVGRDINRHYYTADELRVALTQPIVQSLLAPIQFAEARA